MSPIRRRTLAVVALLLVPTFGFAQAPAEMRRGELRGPANGGFGKIVFSPDGKLLAAGSFMSSTISIFNVAAMKEKVRLQLPHNNYDYHLTFAADCRTLVSAGREDAMIRTWDVVTGKQIREVRKPARNLMALAPGGKRAVFNDRGGSKASAYDLENGKMIWKVDTFAGKHFVINMNTAAFSPDGKTLAIHGGNAEVQIWDAATGALIREIHPNNRGGGGAFKFVTFSPDGTHIATGGHTDDSLHVWEVRTGKERLRIKTKTQYGWCFGASFSPDGTWLAYMLDRFVIYDLVNDKELVQLKGAGGVFSPDGSLLAVPVQGKHKVATITLYDMPKGRQLALPAKLNADQLGTLWQDLTADSDFRVQRVFASFRAAPADAVAFLGKKLNPVGQAERKRVQALLDELDEDDAKTREKAMANLKDYAATFEPWLMQVARDHEPGEVRESRAFRAARPA